MNIQERLEAIATQIVAHYAANNVRLAIEVVINSSHSFYTENRFPFGMEIDGNYWKKVSDNPVVVHRASVQVSAGFSYDLLNDGVDNVDKLVYDSAVAAIDMRIVDQCTDPRLPIIGTDHFPRIPVFGVDPGDLP